MTTDSLTTRIRALNFMFDRIEQHANDVITEEALWAYYDQTKVYLSQRNGSERFFSSTFIQIIDRAKEKKPVFELQK